MDRDINRVLTRSIILGGHFIVLITLTGTTLGAMCSLCANKLNLCGVSLLVNTHVTESGVINQLSSSIANSLMGTWHSVGWSQMTLYCIVYQSSM